MLDRDGDGRPAAQPDIAPDHAELNDTTLRVVVYEDAVRRQNLGKDWRVAFTTWKEGTVAIRYGRAREVPAGLREARPRQGGRPQRKVTGKVRLTRVYAMRAGAGEVPSPHSHGTTLPKRAERLGSGN
jgi:hypothetical protein